MLVVLPVLLVLAVFPFDLRVMERQLARQADERIDEAREGFRTSSTTQQRDLADRAIFVRK